MSNPKKKIPKNIIIFLIIPVIIILIASVISSMMSQKTRNYSEIVNRFKNHEIVEFRMNLGSGDMDIKLKNNEEIHFTAPSASLMYKDIKEHIDSYDKAHPDSPMVYNLIKATETSWIINAITYAVLPMLLFGLMLWFIMRKVTIIGGDGGKSFFGKNKVKKNMGDVSKTKFDMVAGLDEAKEEVMEVVDFLKTPEKYSKLGAKIPKGILFVGPPGTGKTLLAKAIAGEADVPFYSMSGSDFVEMFVGVGASRVRDLFGQAKKTAPCVVFIDEIDAVGRQRGSGLGGHDEREQTLNQLLVEMDGFETNEGVIVIAATNRADILDKALVRAGRFDRSILIGYPDIKGREDILRIHAKGKPFDEDVKLKDVARATAGFTGADLENLLNESALLAARKNQKVITNKNVEEATIRVIAGPEKRSHVMNEKEKKITAYHESGHAIVTHFCKTQDPVHQISIVPRGSAGGYTISLPEKDYMYVSKTKMEEEISTLLAGRVAESLIFDDISTGASNDLERATRMAKSMVTEYGMSDEIGPVVCDRPENGFINSDKIYSEELVSKIDKEVSNFIKRGYEKAKNILEENINILHKVANSLIEKEKLSGDEFRLLVESA